MPYMPDHTLDDNECKTVAVKINEAVVNKQFPSEDDLERFTMLMVELHIRKHNLPSVRIDDFKIHVDAINPPNWFSDDAKKELQCRVDYSHEFVWGLMEKGYSNELDHLLIALQDL